jgi:hypothetical protein
LGPINWTRHHRSKLAITGETNALLRTHRGSSDGSTSASGRDTPSDGGPNLDGLIGGPMSDNFTPRPEHKFTFGLWTVGNRGPDSFGHEVRADAARRRRRFLDNGLQGRGA